MALINEKKREAESQEEMVKIQHNIDACGDVCMPSFMDVTVLTSWQDFSILSADRRFIGQGAVRLVAAQDGAGACPDAWFFLMNDMFLVTKAADETGRFALLTQALIIDCFLLESPDAPTEVDFKLPGRDGALLRLGFSSAEEERSFTSLVRTTILETRREAYESWTAIQQAKGFVTNKSFEEWLSTFFVA